MLTPRQTNRPKRALTSMCMEVTCVACLVFPLSLLWPTLLTCSSRASVTSISLSFLEVYGLPTLFELSCHLISRVQLGPMIDWASVIWAFVFFISSSLSLLFVAFPCNARYPSQLLKEVSRRHLLQLTASPWTTEARTRERWHFGALTNRKATSSNRAPSTSSLYFY